MFSFKQSSVVEAMYSVVEINYFVQLLLLAISGSHDMLTKGIVESFKGNIVSVIFLCLLIIIYVF